MKFYLLSSQVEQNEQIEVNQLVYEGLENILDEEYQSALSKFDRSLELDGDQIMTLSYKARLLNKLDKDVEALEVWKKVLELDPDWTYAKMNKASSLVNMGKNELAILELNDIIAKDPTHLDAKLALMNKLFAEYNLEHFEEAIESCKKLKESGTFDNEIRFWHIWAELMWTLDSRGAEWEQIIREGLQHFPDDLELMCVLCGCLYFQKRFKESIVCCDKVLKIDTSNVSTWLYKAESLAELGESDKAYEVLLVALSIDRENLKEILKEDPKPFSKLNDDRFEKLINRN